MALQKIGKFTLKNEGGFVARGQVTWMDENGERQLSKDSTSDITLGFTRDVNPGDLGVPDGSLVSLYVFVVWGYDNEARQSFLYDSTSTAAANYTITGTTLSNSLGLISVG